MDSEKNADILLNIIDQRCKKVLKKSNIVSKMAGRVVEVSPDNTKASVKFADDNNVFGLLNKTGEKLSVGDNVFVESIKDDLTNGFISERFGTSVIQKEVEPSYVYITGEYAGILVSLPDAHFYDMITFDIIGNGYGTSAPFSTHIQGYHYTPLGNFLHCKQQNTSSNLPQCKFMIKDNKIALWIPYTRFIYFFNYKLL